MTSRHGTSLQRSTSDYSKCTRQHIIMEKIKVYSLLQAFPIISFNSIDFMSVTEAIFSNKFGWNRPSSFQEICLEDSMGFAMEN